MKKQFITIILAFFCGVSPLVAQVISKETLAAHPRILLNKGDVTAMREYSKQSESARLVNDKIITAAIDMLADAPLTSASLESEELTTAVSQRILQFAYAFVMTEDMEYARRAERDMLAISNIGGWSATFAAEYTAALSLGYDWLYHSLPVHSRSIIGTAIYEKGLRQIAAKSDAELGDKEWLALLYGSLSTMERSPEFCEENVRRVVARCNAGGSENDVAFKSLPAMADALTNDVMLIAALQSSLGENSGIKLSDSFLDQAEYFDFMVAPSYQVCNFGDADSSAPVLPVKYWFASQCGDASLVAVDEQLLKAKILPKAGDMPLYMIFASTLDFAKSIKRANSWTSKGDAPLYIYRSGWAGNADSYFAIKGGGNGVNSHSDGGSFIYELNGVRWAVDPECCDADCSKRGAEWHNTLQISGAEHSTTNGAVLTESFTAASRKGAVIDMTPLFDKSVKVVTRTAELDKKDYLKISDHIVVGDNAAQIEWKIMTNAKAEVAGPSIIKLTQDGKEIYMRLSCKNRSSIVIDDLDGLQRVGYSVEVKGGQTVDLEVEMMPLRNNKILNRLLEKFKRGGAATKR